MKNKNEVAPLALNRSFAVVIFLILVAIIASGAVGCAENGGNLSAGGAPAAVEEPSTEFPDFVYNSATSLAAYRLAPRLSTVLSSMPCYCNCGRASGHKNLKDCFFREDGTFNDHASNCDVCQDEAMDVDRWQKEGKSLREIRDAIDAKYRDYGRPTDTPPVE